MDPDPNPRRLTNDERHVRFVTSKDISDHETGDIASSSRRRQSPPCGPSTRKNSSRRARPHLSPSVKAAVQRFHVGEDDADSSILLPSPTNSPSKSSNVAVNLPLVRQPMQDLDGISSRQKGKGRESLPSYVNDKTIGDSHVRGKEDELVAAREEQKKHERRWEKQKERTVDKAQEVEKERDRDKQRIQMLEEEIQCLKDEASHRFPQQSIFL